MTPKTWFAFLFPLLLSAQPGRFGSPACSAPDEELADRSYFLLCHSASRKVPLWVAYELTPDRLEHRATHRSSHFRSDAQLSHPGALDSDYRNSGLSRGHMAPARDFAWSDDALRATYVLSNAVPQYQNPNSGRWAHLEKAVRRVAAASDTVIVFSGPIFANQDPMTIGLGQVAVPSHTYKVVLALEGGRLTMYAAIVPNDTIVSQPLNHFATTVDEVERRTGLDFFAELPDDLERQLESTSHPFPRD